MRFAGVLTWMKKPMKHMNTIKRLRLKNFSAFSDVDFKFSEGINVLIGKNGTGKTHLMKLMAAILKTKDIRSFNNDNYSSQEKMEKALANRLTGFFKPDKLGRLVRRGVGRQKAEVDLETEKESIAFEFATNSTTQVKGIKFKNLTEIPFIYFPPNEMLSTFEGFTALYENREVSFDESYYYLAKSLSVPLAKGPRFKEAKKLLEPLEEVTGAKVRVKNGRFYLKDTSGEMEAHLVAEGLRKIASLMYLISNNELQSNAIFFWDEPEANLNPSLISTVVDVLTRLANEKVQIFISSHDYLVTHLLSLKSEYHEALPPDEKADITFWGLEKGEEGVKVSSGTTLHELEANPILDEYMEYYDKEQKLFEKLSPKV